MAKHKVTQEQADLPTSPTEGQSVEMPKVPERAPSPVPVPNHPDGTHHAPAAPVSEDNGRGEPKPKEPKDVRFRRLVVKRVNKALVALRNVGRLANRNTYSYTEEEAVKVVNALIDSTNKVRDAFAGAKDAGGGFTL